MSDERPPQMDETGVEQETVDSYPDVEESLREAIPQLGPTRSLRQRYLALLWRARVVGAAFWTAMAFLVAWAVPWFPSGLSPEDYSREVLLTFALASSCASLGVAALVFRRGAQKTQESLVAWSALYDDTTGLYNSRSFYDRLSMECDRAKLHKGSFATLLLRLEATQSHLRDSAEGIESHILRTAADELTRRTRATDFPALLSGSQFAVLIGGVSDRTAEEAGARLARSVQEALPKKSGVSVQFGVSSYGSGGRSPNPLLRAAQRDMKRRAQRREGRRKSTHAA